MYGGFGHISNSKLLVYWLRSYSNSKLLLRVSTLIFSRKRRGRKKSSHKRVVVILKERRVYSPKCDEPVEIIHRRKQRE